MTVKKFLLISIIFLLCSCSEEKRFDINSDDTVSPAAPVISRYEALNGSVRIFYTPPADADVISVDAQYTRKSDGEVFHFSTSYFSNSITVLGLADTVTYDVELFAVDRAGNRSPKITYSVKPLESAILKVKQSMIVKGGFDALFAKWTNELGEPVNVFIDYTFTMDGTTRSLTRVFTSQTVDNRYYITDLTLPPDSPVKVKYRVSDNYENYTDAVDVGNLFVLKDIEIPKMDSDRNPLWSLPEVRTIPLAEYGNTVAQVFGNVMDGNIARVIDGTIDQYENLNYLMADAPHPWSLMIDLNGYYELSRILTHQRHTKDGGAEESVKRGNYFMGDNIGRYRMYRWDDETRTWDTISVHTISMPQGTLSQLEWNKLGRAGDMAYMYPDEPAYTKPTRWFRYEAVGSFGTNYYPSQGGSLSEITLYCKQK
ncbi:MAG: DUF4959 domain-containing protein [Prevotellaceae bacterium]|jgi:hypothetical protein|nr:DUF4959 domain-containing protein [Prevotellaceae bacterium]